MEANTWEFAEQLKNNKAELTAAPNNSTREELEAAYEDVWANCEELAEVRCRVCSGFGHADLECPTLEELGLLGAPATLVAEVVAILIAKRG